MYCLFACIELLLLILFYILPTPQGPKGIVILESFQRIVLLVCFSTPFVLILDDFVSFITEELWFKYYGLCVEFQMALGCFRH